MKIFGVAGWSGSGKTTLMVRLLPALARLGLRVATLKHTHHDPLLADPESRRLLAAGAGQVLVAGPRRFAVVARQEAPSLEALAARIDDVDLLLVEGFKKSPHEQLEVWDSSLGHPMLAHDQPQVVAVACDHSHAFPRIPTFRRDDVDGIAAFIRSRIGCR